MSLPQLDGPRLPALGGTARQLVVLVHGYGADGNDLIELGRMWQARFPDAAFAAPNAPQNVPGGAGYQWFPIDRLDPASAEAGVIAAAPALEAFIDAELKAQALGSEDLVLLGFSQGAMMALHIGLSRAVPPRLVLSFSGLLAGKAPMPPPGGTYPPVFLSHGDSDTVIPPQLMFTALGALQQIGAPVEWHLAPNTAHGIDPGSLDLGARALEGALGLET
jgi:phospholipase/carboxylesterase